MARHDVPKAWDGIALAEHRIGRMHQRTEAKSPAQVLGHARHGGDYTSMTGDFRPVGVDETPEAKLARVERYADTRANDAARDAGHASERRAFVREIAMLEPAKLLEPGGGLDRFTEAREAEAAAWKEADMAHREALQHKDFKGGKR